MRLIKHLGLGLIAALALMAVVGVSSAFATELEEVVLCKTNPAEASAKCPVGGSFGSGTKIDALSTSTILLGVKNILCNHVKVSGESTSSLAHGKITGIAWNECMTETESCTVTSQNLPYLQKGELNSTHTGYETLTTSGGTGRPSSRVVCGETDCSYGAENILMTASVVAGHTVLTVNQSLRGEGICFFTTGTWQGEFTEKCLEGTTEVDCYLRME